jgi:hypothetical protein
LLSSLRTPTIADGVDTTQATANVSRFFRDYGVEVVDLILGRTSSIEANVLTSWWKDSLSDEGEKVRELLTRDLKTSLSQLLEGFTIDGLLRGTDSDSLGMPLPSLQCNRAEEEERYRSSKSPISRLFL